MTVCVSVCLSLSTLSPSTYRLLGAVEPGGLRETGSRPLYRRGRWRLRDAGTRGLLAAGSSRAPDSLGTERRPAAGWGDLGGCRCPFPVEGQRARVARGGKERRPFRRVTAAESRWLTHPGRPSLPGPEWPGPGLPREREMPPAVPRSRNWGHWATGPAGTPLSGLAWACRALPGGLGARAQPQGLNPVLLPNTESPSQPLQISRGKNILAGNTWSACSAARMVWGGFYLLNCISQNLIIH